MNGKGIFGIIFGAFAGLFALTLLFGSWYTVDQKERAVVTYNGRFESVSDPGLHFKTPWLESVTTLDIGTQKRSFNGPIHVLSEDQQPTAVILSVNYHLDPARVGEIYSTVGVEYAATLLDPAIFSHTQAVFGKYNSVAITQKRDTISQALTAELGTVMLPRGIIVESVNVEAANFSDEYKKSIEARMQAEVAVERAKQDLARVKVDAEQKVTQAEAEAKATKLSGEAAAYAIDVRGKALRDNPSLVSLTAAEKWNGVLPTTMIPGGGIPFLNLK